MILWNLLSFFLVNVAHGDYKVLHSGGHMVPMSDKAILKQTQLRRLRLEMLKVHQFILYKGEPGNVSNNPAISSSI